MTDNALTPAQIEQIKTIISEAKNSPEGKDLLKSGSFNGMLLMAGTFWMNRYGIPPEAQGPIIDFLINIGVGIGSLWAFVGVITRKSPITSIAGIKLN